MMEALSSSETRFLQEPHGVTSQKTAFFIVTAVKTSNLTILIRIRGDIECQNSRLPHLLDTRIMAVRFSALRSDRSLHPERFLVLNNGVFLGVTPCRSCKNRRFREKFRLHLQGRELNLQIRELCLLLAFTLVALYLGNGRQETILTMKVPR
jgi:hypothetical protein